MPCWPGLIAALLGGYAYLLRSALHPLVMAAAFAPGVLAAGVLLNVGDYLTGVLTGLPSDLPWALPYFGEMQHPVALYRAVGLIVVLLVVWWRLDRTRPQRTLYLAGLGWGLVHLIADGFAANAPMTGPFRTSQVIGLVAGACSVRSCWRWTSPSRDRHARNRRRPNQPHRRHNRASYLASPSTWQLEPGGRAWHCSPTLRLNHAHDQQYTLLDRDRGR